MNNNVDVNDIIVAKEIARRNGYDVSLPDNKVEIAKNVATAAGYTVTKKPEPASNRADIAAALDIATRAGYTVSKPAPAPAATQTTVASATPASETTPATPPPQKSQEDINFDRYLQAAASYL